MIKRSVTFVVAIKRPTSLWYSGESGPSSNMSDKTAIFLPRVLNSDKILKLASLLNAKLNVSKDEFGRKDLTLSIRQRIIDPYVMVEQKEENKGLNVKYFDASDKRILIVNKNNTHLKELLLLLRPYKSDIDVVSSINDMKTKLSDNKTYDMVMIDDTIYNNEKEILLDNNGKVITK